MHNQTHRTIYLDHAATTPVRPEVMAAMEPYFTEFYGNPSSIHGVGRKAGVAIRQARRTIAQQINAQENEIIFTSGGSEGANTALRGIALAKRAQSGANRIITSAIEHHAVLHTAEDLAQNFGFDLTVLGVDHNGLINLDELETALDKDDVALVSIMLANNEVGTIQPLKKIGDLCRTRNILLHSDVVQAAGRIAIDADDLGGDALSTSAHKFYGPKGVGFLYIRSGVPFQPVQTGGSHENSRRAGTENVPLVVGMATAFELAEAERETESARLTVLRDELMKSIIGNVEGAYLTGAEIGLPPSEQAAMRNPSPSEQAAMRNPSPSEQAAMCRRASHIASFIIRDVEAERLLIQLDMAGIAVSSGSACSSGAQRPSHVLTAMGIPAEDAHCGLRLSLGRSNREEDVARVVDVLCHAVAQTKNT